MKPNSFMSKTFGISAILLLLTYPLYSQSITGDWYGKADIQGIELRITVHVKTTDQGYTSTWDSPDQGAFNIPSTTTTFKFPDFSFTHEGAGFKYAGKINSSYDQITGSLEQGGQSLQIVFSRKPIETPPSSPEALKKKYDKKEVYITMRDGVRLFTSIYIPKNNSVSHPMSS